MAQTATTIEEVAYHEAGHVVATHHHRRDLKFRLTSVTINPLTLSGRTSSEFLSLAAFERLRNLRDQGDPGNRELRRWVLAHCVVDIAGAISQVKLTWRDAFHDGWARNITKAGKRLEVLGMHERRWLDLLSLHAVRVVHHYWPQVEALAAALVENESLSGTDIATLLEGAS